MSSVNKKPSWRGQSYQQSPKSPSLWKKRWIATFLLSVMSIAMVFILLQWSYLRESKTFLFAMVVNQGLQQSSQQDNLSIAPLRFTQALPKSLSQLGAARDFHVTEDLSLSLLKLEERLALISKGAQSFDTLVCSVQSQCLTIDGEAILIDANFLLPDDSADAPHESTKGVPIGKLLGLFSVFPGTVVIALDAGDVIADMAAHCQQNDFLLKLQDIVKQLKNERLWVLTSHSPSEISQDVMASKERLFGRALSEALLGTVRVPNSEEFLRQWNLDRRLSLDEVANYVYRRVQSDSGKSQSPWLLHGGEGPVRSDRSSWEGAKSVTFAKLDKQGRIQGLAKAIPSDTEGNTKGTASQAKPEPKTEGKPDAAPIDIWVQNWQKLETTWGSKTNDSSYAWSFAECFPLAYRQRRAQLADAELRSRAGINDSVGVSFSLPALPADWDLQLERLRELHTSVPSQKRWDASELEEKREQAKLLQQVCQASLHVAELRQLISRLDAIGVKPQSQLIRLVDSFRIRSTPDELRAELRPVLNGLPAAIDSLIAETIADPKMAVLESLLLCGSLSAEQREKILNTKLHLSHSNNEYPTSLPEFPASWSKPIQSTAIAPNSPATTFASRLEGAELKEPAKSIATIVAQGLQDDRLVARKDQSISIGSQLASLPPIPARKQGWWHEWQQKGTSLVQPMRLEPTQRIEFALRLDPFPKPNEIRIQTGSLPKTIVSLKLDGQRIDESNPTFTRKWSSIEQNTFSIQVELESSDIAAPGIETLSLRISGDNGPSNGLVPLQLRLASKERIDLQVNRLIRKDGKEQWWPEEASIQGKVFRLHPFAGHETRFSLEAINRGENTKNIQADLYSLPSRIGIPGVLVSNNGFIQGDLSEDAVVRLARKTPAIASAKGLELKPNQTTKMVLLPKASPPPPAAESNKLAEAAKPSGPPPPMDLSAGMALVLSDSNNGTVLESFLFEYDPSIPSEYIEAFATVEANEQSRVISVISQFRDTNEDGVADLSPTDNQPIQVAVFREPWMGTNPKGEFSGVIDPSRKAPLKLSMQIPREASDEVQPFLALDVSAFPRALTKEISLRDLQRQALESYKGSKPRAAIRSISDGTKTYWSVLPIDSKPDANFPFVSKSIAIFKQPRQVEVAVAMDWALDIVNGQMLFAEVHLGETKVPIYGDRKWSFQATKIDEDGLAIVANAADHSVRIDSLGMQNRAIKLQAIALDQDSNSIAVVFDSQLPEIKRVKLASQSIFKGEETTIEFEIQENDLSGVDRFDVLVLNNLNEEKLKLPFAFKQNEWVRGSRSVERKLQVGKLESGVYQVVVATTDLAGNGPTKSEPISLRIRDKPVPVAPNTDGKSGTTAASVLGNISGKVRFTNGDEPTQAKVTLDSNGKSGDFPNGNFKFSEVPLGKYKITAEFPYQSSNWVGEASGEFKSASDFQKEIEIKCKKSP